MTGKPIDKLIHSGDIFLYLIGRRLVNLNIDINEEDVNVVKKLSEEKELDEIVKIMLKKYRNYTDEDYRRCQIAISY